MSILHTLNKAELLPLGRRAMQSGDSLVLIENGVYLAVTSQDPPWPEQVQVYALESDLSARGLAGRIQPGIKVLSMSSLVSLCCNHDRVINWF